MQPLSRGGNRHDLRAVRAFVLVVDTDVGDQVGAGRVAVVVDVAGDVTSLSITPPVGAQLPSPVMTRVVPDFDTTDRMRSVGNSANAQRHQRDYETDRGITHAKHAWNPQQCETS